MRWLQRIRPTELKTCSICGTAHRLEDLQVTCGKPDDWFEAPEDEQVNWESVGRDFVHRRDDRFFIRCQIEMPVISREKPFGYGVWAEVSTKVYWRYAEIFVDEDQGQEPPFQGVLANRIRQYEPGTLGLNLSIHLRDERTRPYALVTDGAHPLAVAQLRGITVDDVLAIHHAPY